MFQSGERSSMWLYSGEVEETVCALTPGEPESAGRIGWPLTADSIDTFCEPARRLGGLPPAVGRLGSFSGAGAWWLVAPFPAPLGGWWVGAVGRCVSPSQAGHTALAWYTVLVLRDST
ncbi:hypothetical protein GCM10023080_066340 [Streptomyces pseudoechinosporeus]